MKYKIKLSKVKDIFKDINSSDLKVINIDIKYKNPFNVPREISSKFVMKSLNLAHKLALNKNVAGIINCPINKIL